MLCTSALDGEEATVMLPSELLHPRVLRCRSCCNGHKGGMRWGY
jgi:hypothetical protein